MGETGIEEELFVGYATGYEYNGHAVSLCSLQDTEGQFAHEGLSVS
jgi:hypothetical protein